jgi:regulator of PEP synthase PpsR (kinase-PPPase family)
MLLPTSFVSPIVRGQRTIRINLMKNNQPSFPLYVMSGGVGASGEQLAQTVLAQFPEAQIKIELFPKVFTKRQIRQVLQNAVENGAVVAHTFVNPKLRKFIRISAADMNLVSIDLIGPLMERISEKLSQEPLGKPGLYRQLYQSYFDRISAMDYTLAHDDGKNPDGWRDAEIVLAGPSRVGKTPIGLYLSVIGWKVANVPLMAGISPQNPFFELDKHRVIGLTIAPSELIEHRKHRQRRLGVGAAKSDYTDPQKVYEEIDTIEQFLRRHGISLIDVTGKPIETSAGEVIRLMKRRLKIPK